MPPICPGYVFPPNAIVAQIHGAAWFSKHRGARHQERRVGVRVHGGIGRTLASRDVACGANEFPKLGVGHGIWVYPQSLHSFLVRRALFAIELV